MIVLTTRGWRGAAVEVILDGDNDTFSVPGDVANGWDVALALREWLDDAARPWSATCSDFVVSLVPAADGVRLRLELGWTGPTVGHGVAPTGEWIARFGDWSTGGGIRGSSCVQGYGIGWEQWDNSRGHRSQQGGWRMGDAVTAHRRPRVQFVWTPDQYMGFRDGLEVAAQPRSAYLRDDTAGVWRFVALGGLTTEHPEEDTKLIVATFDCLGSP